MVSEHTSSYRKIFKATSLFGGVQIYITIIQIIRNKSLAILLGPSGMGIAGLLTSTTNLISGITSLGLRTSAVKNIAAASRTGDNTRVAIVAAVLRRLVWVTGILGTLTVLIISPWLSKITFGNNEYTIAFVCVSITLLFSQLNYGQLVILQGMRKLKYLAKANILGNGTVLLVVIPLYYKLGVDGIVPAIISSSVIILLFSWFFSRKVFIESVKINRDDVISEGKDMLAMGFMISISGLIALGFTHIIRLFISQKGGVEQVGLYNAGFAIINTYVGMIFTALSTDYYPRLSSVSDNNELCKHTINQQAEIAILILAPLLIIFLVFVNWVVIILYSTKFTSINTMIHCFSLGMFFRAPGWAVTFLFLAKGTSKLYFLSELLANTYYLIFCLIGYKYLGLTGVGISFLIANILSLIQICIFAKIKFRFKYNNVFIKVFYIQFTFAIVSFLCVKLLQNPYSYFIGVILIVLSSWFSFKELDKRIEIGSLVVNLKNKFIHQ